MTSTDLVERQEQTAAITTGETAEDLRRRLIEMKQKVALLQSFFKEVMVEGEDYGKIPGTDKPTLYKAGAEKLCEFYGYSIVIADIQQETDRETGFCRAVVKVRLVSRRTGEVIAEGVGEANTLEGRYRWREIGRSYQEPYKSNPEAWEQLKRDAARVVTKHGDYGPYEVAYKENDDPHTLWNTILKMAKKRGVVDAALSATRSSGIFTQDLEDLREWANAGEIVEGEYTVVSDDEPGRRPVQSRPAQQTTRQATARRGAGASSGPVTGLTDRQIKRLYAIAGKAKVNAQDVTRALYRHGVDDLTREEYDELCAALEAGEIRKLLRTRIYMRARDAGYTDDAIKAELMAAAGHESLMTAATDDLLKLPARLAIPEEPEAQQPPAEAVTA